MSNFSYWRKNSIHYYCDRKSQHEYLYLSMNENDLDSVIRPTKEYPLGWVFCTLYRCLLRLCVDSSHVIKENIDPVKTIRFKRYEYERRTLRRYIWEEVFYKGERSYSSKYTRKESSVVLSNYLIKLLLEMNADWESNEKIEELMNFINGFITNFDNPSIPQMTMNDLAHFCDSHNLRLIGGCKVFSSERIHMVSEKEHFSYESAEKAEDEIEALEVYRRRFFKTKSNRIARQKYNRLGDQQKDDFYDEFYQFFDQKEKTNEYNSDIRDYQIDSIEYLFIASLQEILTANYSIRECGRCGGIFIAKRRNAKYCEFRQPKFEDKTCRQYEALLKQRQRERDDICSRVYRRVSAMLLQRTTFDNNSREKTDTYQMFLYESWERRQQIYKLSPKSQKYAQEVIDYLLWASSFYKDNRYEGEFEKFVDDNSLRMKDADPQEKQKDKETNDLLIATYHHMKEFEN